jgi:glutamate racemase
MIKNRPDYSNDGFSGYDKDKKIERIGIFDSGIGGLSVLKCLIQTSSNDKLTNRNNKEIIYVADNGRFPYGMKTPQQIYAYTEQIIHWLEKKDVDLIIFGCNTANAIVGKKIKEITKLPVLDLIDPVAKYVSQLQNNIAVLATEATVNSHAFSKAIKTYCSQLSVIEIAASELVNIVETGQINSKETDQLIAKYAQQFSKADIGTVVLGCTHFSFLKENFRSLMDKKTEIIDPAELLAQMIAKYSQDDHQLTDNFLYPDHVRQLTFFVTGDKESFTKIAIRCLEQPVKNVNQLSMNDLELL